MKIQQLSKVQIILLAFAAVISANLTTVRAQPAFHHAFDFDGNGEADFAVRRDGNRTFNILHSSNGWTRILQYGFDTNTDRPVVGDFDGDGKGDIAVYRLGKNPGEQNVYYALESSTGTIRVFPWGICCSDFNVSRDYDGDGKTDFTVARTGMPGSPAFWYINQSTNGQLRAVQFGTSGDEKTFGDAPVSQDYDGDGKADIAIYRIDIRETPQTPDRNTYYVLQSSNNQVRAQQWGNYETDYATPADYDGDGKADFAVFRGFGGSSNGVWYILQSTNGQMRAVQWGLDGDEPVQKDYDGDGKVDLTVRRGSIWFILRSTNNQLQVVDWGLPDDFVLNYIGNS